MSENKNIVIKVKYPSSGGKGTKTSSQPNVITEWNFKRIGVAIGSLLLVLVSLFYITDSDDKQTNTKGAQLVLPEQTTDIIAQSDKVVKAPEQPKFDADKAVARAQLTSDIEKNEPVNNLKLPLKIGKKETLWIYYFVELKGMQGKAVFHEWWLNGNLVSRKKVNISDDPWRTASKQLITYTTNNDWIVRVVDDSRNKLVEQSFNLDLK